MERECLLGLLILLVCGPVLLVTACIPLPRVRADSARDLERLRARRVLLPLLAAAVASAILAGWALQEPDATKESLAPYAIIIAAIYAAVVARACLRALRSVVRRPEAAPAFTMGLLRPRIFVSEALRVSLGAHELSAVIEHEAAHARHRDPLRILALQFVADLQWPVPRAQARLRDWRCALELSRDEEAREHGVDGDDLASGILFAARLTRGGAALLHPASIVSGDGGALRERIEWLLVAHPSIPARQTARLRFPLLATLMVLVGVLVGCAFGESTVRGLPGVIAEDSR